MSQVSDVLEALERGLECQGAGQVEEAEAIYNALLERDPHNAEAMHLLGLAAFQRGRLEAAAERLRDAIALRPTAPFYHNNLGNILQALGRFAEATLCYRDALRLNPNYAEAHNNLAAALIELDRFSEAILSCREALRLRPGYGEAHNTMGNAQARLGYAAEAAGSFREAIRLTPHYTEAHGNLGNVLLENGRLEEAEACYREALRWNPSHARTRWNRAWLLLLKGDFERGFREFEMRWVTGNAAPRQFRQPLWDGSPLAGRTILLHAEQALGDTVQFIRYAPLVKQAGGTVVVECQPRLAPLVETVAGVDRVVEAGAALPSFDTYAPLLSLPRIFGTRLETIPAEVPYLKTDPARVEHWRRRIASVRGHRVGLVWAGRPKHRNDHHRSLSLAALAPLAQVRNVAWFSLQRGPQAAELATAPLEITNLEEEGNQITDTAAILANLDLLISVDTMVAHLAGALGRPVWTLLAHVPDWRWLLDREDSPWYPTMRLLRQPQPGNWEAVIQQVAREFTDAERG